MERKRVKVQLDSVFADAKSGTVNLLRRIEGDEGLVQGEARFFHVEK